MAEDILYWTYSDVVTICCKTKTDHYYGLVCKIRRNTGGILTRIPAFLHHFVSGSLGRWVVVGGGSVAVRVMWEVCPIILNSNY